VIIAPTGFREYDARWLFPQQLDLDGARALGLGLAQLIHDTQTPPRLVTGHDFRSYSESVKQALVAGLVAGGVEVHDVGLAVTPMAYFAQFALKVPAVAMVTASHNENGWTGVKMGLNPPLTFGPDEMTRLKDIVLDDQAQARPGGKVIAVPGFSETYLAALAERPCFTRKIRAVVACGNGTAGFFAPRLLERLGIEVIPLHCTPDFSFPHYNPNPEDLAMLHDMARAVKEHKADLALGFDGDGDRVGVVMDDGHEIFADKLGVLIARNLAAAHPGARFVVDVKSTGLFATDPELQKLGAQTDYYKTGHSYIKRRTAELGALAGFEKSGHFFFHPPYGRGYDDALVSALQVLDLLQTHPAHTLSHLAADLPPTFQSPTMSPHCPDETKYRVVAELTEQLHSLPTLAGQKILSRNTVNGIRVTVADGTWGLIRASSNKPELVVVVESPVSLEKRNEMFAALEALLALHPEVGPFNQKL
jgi:phosphomannomutase/phosphoglucomutase